MTTQIVIRLDVNVKEKMTQLAQHEGKSASQVIRELIDNYIQQRDIAAYIDDLWDRVGNKLKSRGVTTEDIERTIEKVRAEKR